VKSSDKPLKEELFVSDREEKRAQFEPQRQRSKIPLVVGLVVALLAVGAGFWAFEKQEVNGKYPAVSVRAGQVVIPLEQVSDGQAHFFSHAYKDGVIDFFVLKSHDGVIRVAFDTCDVCYRDRQGYRQEGDHMVCNNCGQQFRSDLINEVKGGCNPAPLSGTIRADQLVIAEADLLEGAWYFQPQQI
jgi:uncharacterized membrane protein